MLVVYPLPDKGTEICGKAWEWTVYSVNGFGEPDSDKLNIVPALFINYTVGRERRGLLRVDAYRPQNQKSIGRYAQRVYRDMVCPAAEL